MKRCEPPHILTGSKWEIFFFPKVANTVDRTLSMEGEYKADGKAAPQLLWALRSIHAALDQAVQYEQTTGPASILREDCRFARNIARDAIAAATGAA